MLDNQRFKEIISEIKYRERTTQRDLALSLELKPTYISDMINGRVPITNKVLERIYELYPYTNKEEMLKSYSSGEEKTPIESSRLVPLLPLTAQGGSLLNFADSVRAEDCEQIRSPINEVDFAIAVRGDSMAPEYPNGSQVLIKKINERAFIEWGKVYVLDTCNGSVIKKILPSEDGDESKVKCVSINPEYPPFHVAFEDIYGMYRVLLCMSVK